MKLGASEYLIKPFDRVTLATALGKILQNRRLKIEHARLLAENIEYMGERSLFERASALFSCLAVDPLAARIVEGLCVETRAQGGSVWIADDDRPDHLNLAAVRGLVRVNEEPDVLAVADVPAELVDGSQTSVLRPWGEAGGEERPALYFAMRREGRLIGLVRLTDKLGHDEFDSVDQACGEKFVEFGETALANALRFASMEQRSLLDPDTGAYLFEYFQDVVRSEIEKSNRFGRHFAVLKLDFGSRAPLPRRVGGADHREWLADVVKLLQGATRSADILAADGEGRFLVLLPETDALGGAVSKRRVEQALDASDLISSLDPAERPQLHLALVTYPGDGTQLESLLRVLDERIEADCSSTVRALGLERMSLAESLAALIQEGDEEQPEVADGIVRFLLSEVGRRPDDRGLLFIGPGAGLWGALTEGLEELVGVSSRTEVVVVSERPKPEALGSSAVWLTPPENGPLAPFAVRYSDGAVYALLRSEKVNGEGVRLFHTNERNVVEFLTFRLQRELALPELA
jgi:diguanylate cyclase (GGDEF)-like protein